MSSFNFQKLSFKQAYLSLEQKDVDEICSKNNIAINEYLAEHYPEALEKWSLKNQETAEKINNKEPTDRDVERHEATINLPKNKDLKKLYRKIAEKTHPDKVGSDKYSSMFSDSAKAYQDNNLGLLIEIAGRLNIEVSELSPESILLLEENIKFLENDIIMKKKSTSWAWELTVSKEEKDMIIESVLQQKGVSIYD
jgi:hypothetical protein